MLFVCVCVCVCVCVQMKQEFELFCEWKSLETGGKGEGEVSKRQSLASSSPQRQNKTYISLCKKSGS